MGTLWLAGPPRRALGVNGKTNVFLTFFPSIAFPWSVALKSLGATSAPRSPPKLRKQFILNGLERFLGTLLGRPFFGRNAPMQRGVRFFWRRSVPMQRGARFLILGLPFDGPTWTQ